jgi:ribosomal protein S18 acetylase RimI-like enzyme
MIVLPARPVDVGDYAAHLARHLQESGREGSFHFGITRDVSRDQVEQHMEMRWAVGPETLGWARAWLLWDRDPRGSQTIGPRMSVTPVARVRGHAELRGPFVPTSMHRALFSIGIERAHVRQGHGSHMMKEVIAWAVEARALDWIDLQVFASNAPARALYRGVGFVDVGTSVDAFRMDDGTSIDDVHMVLDLRGRRPRDPNR